MNSRMKLLFAGWLLLVTWSNDVMGSGAGRAFPLESENYVIKQFQSINPGVEWDPTNFLVDLAGRYANCKFIGRRGPVDVKETTPSGASVAGYHDYTDGWGADVDAVNGYLRQTIDRWMRSSDVHTQVRLAARFGCSVRPACEGQVSISCMFSNPEASNIELPSEPIGDQPIGEPQALAFTPQQYKLTESMTGSRWDRSHFLENLSGFETDCAMVGARSWSFTKINQFLDGEKGYGVFGYSQNRGSTDTALVEILKGFNKELRYAKKMGCSIIPHCVIGRDMFVVAACVYVE